MYNGIKLMGIYKIENSVNGKIYIGSSKDIKYRWNQHISSLKNGKHHNKYLQRAWDKYGEDKFNFGILELVEFESDLTKREREWIIKKKSTCSDYGYNISDNTDRPSNFKFMKVYKKKLQDYIMSGKFNKNEMIVLFAFISLVCDFENCIKIKGKYPEFKELIPYLQVKKTTFYEVVKSLTEKNIIHIKKTNGVKVIYINPSIICNPTYTNEDVFQLFNIKSVNVNSDLNINKTLKKFAGNNCHFFLLCQK